MSKIGEIIAKLRGKDSLREASKKIGISHTYLDTIEKGFDKRSKKPVKPSPDTLRLISNAYNYPYKELMKAAGYITEVNEINEKEQNSLSEIEKIIKDLGIDSFFFKDIEAWKNLRPEDVEELKRHFEYVAHKAKERNKDVK